MSYWERRVECGRYLVSLHVVRLKHAFMLTCPIAPLMAQASLTSILSLMRVIFQMPETDQMDEVGVGP